MNLPHSFFKTAPVKYWSNKHTSYKHCDMAYVKLSAGRAQTWGVREFTLQSFRGKLELHAKPEG